MGNSENTNDLVQLVTDLEEDKVIALVKEQITEGKDLLMILQDCQRGLFEVGKRYEKRKYFVSALIMAGEIMNQVSTIIQPLLTEKHASQGDGDILLGTVQGDIHYLGKDLFKVLARCQGFTVNDLGVDVPPEKFLSACLEHQPDIVGMSCLLQLGFDKLKETITLLTRETRTWDKKPVFVIGGLVDKIICKGVGADFCTDDAMEGVRICQRIIQDQSNG